MTAPKQTTIKKQLTVEAPIERAFRVFTAHMSTWWPKSHHIGKTALVECVVEPRVGGRWYEICEDGTQCEWGKVLAWDPPNRLVLAWQLNGQYAYDPDLITEVEVRFAAIAPGRTHVDFEHRDLDKIGAQFEGDEGMNRGWGLILEQFTTAATH